MSDVLASYSIINSICLFFKGFSGAEGGALWWMSPNGKWARVRDGEISLRESETEREGEEREAES